VWGARPGWLARSDHRQRLRPIRSAPPIPAFDTMPRREGPTTGARPGTARTATVAIARKAGQPSESLRQACATVVEALRAQRGGGPGHIHAHPRGRTPHRGQRGPRLPRRGETGHHGAAAVHLRRAHARAGAPAHGTPGDGPGPQERHTPHPQSQSNKPTANGISPPYYANSGVATYTGYESAGGEWHGPGQIGTVTTPNATTEPASALNATTATLNGSVDPLGAATTYHFPKIR
jgi:hypothetical protein